MQSWQQLGFDVVSFNHATEVDKVQPHFDGVTFLEAKESAVELFDFDIPYVSIVEILRYVFDQDEPSWIVNSDVILRISQNKIRQIQRVAQETVVFGCRIDVEDYVTKPIKPETYEDGFDYFVLSGNIDHLFMSSRIKMCMGQPWWDFWVPLTCIRKGLSPVKCEWKIAYHIKHETNWNMDQLYFFGSMLARDIGMKGFDRAEMPAFTEIVARTIRSGSETFSRERYEQAKSDSTSG